MISQLRSSSGSQMRIEIKLVCMAPCYISVSTQIMESDNFSNLIFNVNYHQSKKKLEVYAKTVIVRDNRF